MAESYFARPENAAEILAAAAFFLAARVRGTDHASIHSERRRAIDDAINLYGELMQRLSALPDSSARMDTAVGGRPHVEAGRGPREEQARGTRATLDVDPKRSAAGG